MKTFPVMQAMFVLCMANLVHAESLGEPLTYRRFDVEEADGRVLKMKPVPDETPPRWARDVSPKPFDWRARTNNKPFFAKPIPFVLPPVDEGEPFGRHNHQPSITWLPNGDLLAIWYSTGSESGTELTVLASRLRPGREAWDPSSEFFKAPNRNMHGSSIFHNGQGTIYHFNGMAPDGGRGWAKLALLMRASTDNGVTWTPPKAIDARLTGRHQVISGTLVTTGGVLIQNCDAVPGGNGGTALHISRDGGKTWTDPGEGKPRPDKYNEGGKGEGNIAGIHAKVAELTDARLLAFGRGDTINGRMPMSISQDLGKTWTYHASPFPPIGGGQRLVLKRLNEGPLLFVSFTSGSRRNPEANGMTFTDQEGNTFTGHGMYAALSFDDGQTWPVRKLLTPGEGEWDGGAHTRTFTATPARAEHAGYLAVTQTPDGVIHLISSRLHYRFNVAWLTAGTRASVLPFANRTKVNERSLEQLLDKLDMELYEQSEADIRGWLDARIEAVGGFPVYPWSGNGYLRGDSARLNLNRGALADSAAQFFRAYEMFGNQKYLEAGLKTADFFLAIQQPAGNFPSGATVYKDGQAKASGGKTAPHVARMEDGYQFRPFALLMYAYKLTDDNKYFDGAKKLADLVTQRMQHPEWGWCPDEFDTRIEGDASKQKAGHGNYGVRGGGSYSDFATTDGFRVSVIMYHATGNKNYLKRSAKLGKWIFATQLGKGEVRGWADNYNAENEPVPAREFEGLSIDPRNFNRFLGPLTAWFYAMSGDEKYGRLFQESYTWLKAREHPDGWAAEYTYDGHEAWTQGHETYRYDQPETWPQKVKHVAVKDGKPWYSRGKVQLEDTGKMYELLQKGGREALIAAYGAPTQYNEPQYVAARLAAARRCNDQGMQVVVHDLKQRGVEAAVEANYLDRVRLRLAAPGGKNLPSSDSLRRTGLASQSWHGPHTWYEPYRPPFGWASWQYVWDARLAFGLIDADTAAAGGRGLENMHCWPAWDVMGDWTTRCLEVENWLELPLAEVTD